MNEQEESRDVLSSVVSIRSIIDEKGDISSQLAGQDRRSEIEMNVKESKPTTHWSFPQIEIKSKPTQLLRLISHNMKTRTA